MASLRHIHSGSAFPKGKRKSDLFDYFPCHWDFACSQDDYDMDLELMRAEERAGFHNCRCIEIPTGDLS